MFDEDRVSEAEKLYEDGKHRRYGLLFAVNGGAFAVAKLFAEGPKCRDGLGGLTIAELAYGMVLFTGVMAFDIWKFGMKMRKRTPGAARVFGTPGRVVLLAIGLLVAMGWLLVSRTSTSQ
jgi:hypothetical protein